MHCEMEGEGETGRERVNFKIERNSFSKYVLDLLVEQFAPYCEARFSFFKITTPPNSS